jgi:hypothetical protein
VIVQKGKGKFGVEGKGPRPMRGFKAKKKVSFFKPKAGLGLGVDQGRGPEYSGSNKGSPSHLGKSQFFASVKIGFTGQGASEGGTNAGEVSGRWDISGSYAEGAN